jgi:hypothetical protein
MQPNTTATPHVLIRTLQQSPHTKTRRGVRKSAKHHHCIFCSQNMCMIMFGRSPSSTNFNTRVFEICFVLLCEAFYNRWDKANALKPHSQCHCGFIPTLHRKGGTETTQRGSRRIARSLTGNPHFRRSTYRKPTWICMGP